MTGSSSPISSPSTIPCNSPKIYIDRAAAAVLGALGVRILLSR